MESIIFLLSSLLHIALYRNHTNIIKYLAEKGGVVNIKYDKQFSNMYLAIYNRNIYAVLLFIYFRFNI